MSASLETRAPFLDHRVIELAWQLPLSAKVAGTVGKRILRDILDRYIPRRIMERPKQGFAIPLDRWLRGTLKDWAGDMLEAKALHEAGVFDADAVSKLWDAHQAGKDNAGMGIAPEPGCRYLLGGEPAAYLVPSLEYADTHSAVF